jgi:hypothetical protein
MPGIRRGIPASQLARDYGVSLNEFSDSVIGLVTKEWAEQDDGKRAFRRREICAAVSAAMLAAFDASMLAPEEREKLQPLVNEVLLPFWNKHCAQDDPGLAEYINSRTAHYLEGRVDDSRVKSAIAIVSALLEAIDAPEHLRPALKERLVPAFAHRMVGDVYRINDVRRKYGIELSMLATVCALLQLSMSYDPVLRALRIV